MELNRKGIEWSRDVCSMRFRKSLSQAHMDLVGLPMAQSPIGARKMSAMRVTVSDIVKQYHELSALENVLYSVAEQRDQ